MVTSIARLDLVLLDLAVQVATLQLQCLRGLGHVVLVTSEHAFDVVLLEAVAGFLERVELAEPDLIRLGTLDVAGQVL